LAKVKRELRRPAGDAQIDDADLYELLTEGCRYAQQLLAVHGFEQNAEWEQATTSDSKTYTIDGTPMGVIEARDGRNGTVLVLGPDSDPQTDLVWQGSTFLVPNNETRTFGSGLWVRYTPQHPAMSAAVQPTLSPSRARYLAVFKAAELWMDRGGYKDATVFSNKLHRMAFGDPSIPGDVGLVSAMKQPFVVANSPPTWWRGNPNLTY
jgi:hypothetical protein